MKTLDPRSIEEYEKVIKNGVVNNQLTSIVSNWSYSRKSVLRSALNYGSQVGWLSIQDAQLLIANIPFPARKPKHRIPPPTEVQGLAFEKVAKMSSNPEKEFALLLLFMGLRISELMKLKREDVKYAVEEGQLLVLRKNSKESLLPCHSVTPLLTALLKHPFKWNVLGELAGKDLELRDRIGKVRRWINRIGKEAGFKLAPHALRRLCATRMHKAGADILYIKEWLGHENIETTMLYVSVDMARAANFVRPYEE